jgi:hypothetical protein
MRVAVTGGRLFRDVQFVCDILDQFHIEVGIDALIEGEADGLDLIARAWAEWVGVPVDPYPANWDRYDNFAGSVRNTQMIREGKPDIVIAFKGGKGTRDMRYKTEAAGILLLRVDG